MLKSFNGKICLIAATILLAASVSKASAQEARHFRFAYDQPKGTGYGIAGDLFADKIKELSKGKTFAKTAAKSGALKARKQAIAIALSEKRKS